MLLFSLGLLQCQLVLQTVPMGVVKCLLSHVPIWVIEQL